MLDKEPFILNLRKQAITGNSLKVKTTPRDVGDIAIIDTIAISNLDSDNKLVHLGICRNEFELYFDTLVLTTNSRYYVSKPKIYIPSGYRIVVNFITPTSGDDLIVNIFGHIEAN